MPATRGRARLLQTAAAGLLLLPMWAACIPPADELPVELTDRYAEEAADTPPRDAGTTEQVVLSRIEVAEVAPVLPLVPRAGAGTQGIGRACATDSECGTGQYCRQDTEYYVGHGQCTATCEAPEDCQAAFGMLTTCVETGFCAALCLIDGDCTERTRCISSHWCKRTGEGSGVPYCAGTPTPCALQTSGCSKALGCMADSKCRGEARPCASHTIGDDCITQRNCTWSEDSGQCSGTIRPCDSFQVKGTCERQVGCRWDAECHGTPLPCDEHPPYLCDWLPGCQSMGP